VTQLGDVILWYSIGFGRYSGLQNRNKGSHNPFLSLPQPKLREQTFFSKAKEK
jgi:hypothetical protein